MSNFICEKCGMTNIDCGYQGYKTEREIELEKQLDREIKINRMMKSALEKYADNINWGVDRFSNKYKKWLRSEDGFKLAKKVIKEIDNKE